MRLPGQSSFIGWIKADTKERRVKDNSWFKQKVCKYISLYFHTSNTTLSSHFLPCPTFLSSFSQFNPICLCQESLTRDVYWWTEQPTACRGRTPPASCPRQRYSKDCRTGSEAGFFRLIFHNQIIFRFRRPKFYLLYRRHPIFRIMSDSL